MKFNQTSTPSPTPSLSPSPRYILRVFVNYTYRTVGKPMTEEEVLKALDQIPEEYRPEVVELVPPKEERYTRTIRPSTIAEKEMKRDWQKVPLKRCGECGKVDLWIRYDRTEYKCMTCGERNGEYERVFIPKEREWKVVGK